MTSLLIEIWKKATRYFSRLRSRVTRTPNTYTYESNNTLVICVNNKAIEMTATYWQQIQLNLWKSWLVRKRKAVRLCHYTN